MIENNFYLLEATISSHDLTNLPCKIFNSDESGFSLSPKPPNVVARKVEKHPLSLFSNEKSQITVLACCNAGGYAIAPLIIFGRKSLKPKWI